MGVICVFFLYGPGYRLHIMNYIGHITCLFQNQYILVDFMVKSEGFFTEGPEFMSWPS